MTSTNESNKCCPKCTTEHPDFDSSFANDMMGMCHDKSCPCHTSIKENDWRERFAKKIATYDKDGGFIVYVEDYDNGDFDVDLIQSFIESELTRVREGERARILAAIENSKAYGYHRDFRSMSAIRHIINNSTS